jgi:hypothetical protein
MLSERARARKGHVSLQEFFRYRFHICPPHIESVHLFLSGRLFQEYVCESWAIAEQKRLAQLRHGQTQLRSEVYQGLADVVAATVDTDITELGKRFILPSSFSGSTRNMQQHCQDALAINRHFGGGDLFVTMTANPKWHDILHALLPGQIPNDCPDVVVRVFRAADEVWEDLSAIKMIGPSTRDRKDVL